MDYLQEGINSPWVSRTRCRSGSARASTCSSQDGNDRGRLRPLCFHLQVVVDEEPRQDLRNVSYSAPTDPVQGEGAIAAAFAAEPELPAADPGLIGGMGEMPMDDATPMMPEVAQQPVRVEKTPGRNEPCFCGSGKKYKLCHGR